MRKILIIIGLFVSLALMGQGMNVMHTTSRVAAPGGGGVFPEMITDGDFPDATNWDVQSSWGIAGGVASYDAVANEYIRQIDADMVSSIVVNTDYNIQFDITNASGNATMRFYNYALNVLFVASDDYTNGHHSVNFTSPADVSGAGFLILGRVESDSGWDITNVSLKER